MIDHLLPALAAMLAILCIVLAGSVLRARYDLLNERSKTRVIATKLDRVEAEARRLQTVRRDFVANISHELRTPLASIKLLVETLDDGALDDPEMARNFIRRIGTETDHLIAMAQELLDLARLEAAPEMHPRVLDAADLVRRAVERMRALARNKNIALRADLPLGLPAVWADDEQTGRVFVNLLNNALTFTPEGGSIVVSARPEGDAVAFSVTDTGPGIPPGEESRIFERFYKADTARRRGGVGLGLSIARHIVEAQGGHIDARNCTDAGACFTFTLPRAAGDATERQ